jgi:hypothetical protein
MYKDQSIQEKFKQEPIQMSDECKININDIINKMYHSWHK